MPPVSKPMPKVRLPLRSRVARVKSVPRVPHESVQVSFARESGKSSFNLKKVFAEKKEPKLETSILVREAKANKPKKTFFLTEVPKPEKPPLENKPKIIQVLHQTYEDEDPWETMLAGQLRFLLDVIDATGAPVTEGALLRLADLKTEWNERQVELQAIQTEDIDVINEWARRKNVPHVASPGR